MYDYIQVSGYTDNTSLCLNNKDFIGTNNKEREGEREKEIINKTILCLCPFPMCQ